MFCVPAKDGFEVVPNLVKHDFAASLEHLFRDRIRVLPKPGQLREQLLWQLYLSPCHLTQPFSPTLPRTSRAL